MARGSCLCGAIAFEIDGPGVVVSVGCFCTNCRKISGSQYGVYLQVKRHSFRWLSGEDRVIAYESSPGNKRAFCGTCGSVAPIATSLSPTSFGAVRVPGGALDIMKARLRPPSQQQLLELPPNEPLKLAAAGFSPARSRARQRAAVASRAAAA
jgi:hypothetical protein